MRSTLGAALLLAAPAPASDGSFRGLLAGLERVTTDAFADHARGPGRRGGGNVRSAGKLDALKSMQLTPDERKKLNYRSPAILRSVGISRILPLGAKVLWIVPSPKGDVAAVNLRLAGGAKKIYLMHLDSQAFPRHGLIRLYADDDADESRIDEDQFTWGGDSRAFCLIRTKQVKGAGQDTCYIGTLDDLPDDGKRLEVKRARWHGKGGVPRSLHPSINSTGTRYATVHGEYVWIFDRQGVRAGKIRGTQPVWHPSEADVLAYVERQRGRLQVFVWRVGDSPEEVGGRAWADSNEKLPAWSPDGRALAFYSDRAGPDNWELYWTVVRAAKRIDVGAPQRAIEDVYVTLDSTSNYTRPCWPAGSSVLMAFRVAMFDLPPLACRYGLGDVVGAGNKANINLKAVLPENVKFVNRAGDLWAARRGYVVSFIVDQDGRREGYIALTNLRP